jgi:GMP synthase (glutamine-hydrolysing)
MQFKKEPRRALMLRHMKRMRGDRVSNALVARGFELDYRCPAEGEPLPRQTDGHDLAVVYGGVQSANDDGYIGTEIEWIREWVSSGGAYLGLCLGAQLLARAFGAEVFRHPEGQHEIGFVRIHPADDLDFLPAPLHVYQWHKEGFELPAGARLLARGEVFRNQAFALGEAAFGIQFHPEVTQNVMLNWMNDSAASLSAPGASPREQQLRDAGRHNGAVDAWLDRFLDRRLLPKLNISSRVTARSAQENS